MKRNVLLILVSHRQETAEKVQKILTGWGCFILKNPFGNS